MSFEDNVLLDCGRKKTTVIKNVFFYRKGETWIKDEICAGVTGAYKLCAFPRLHILHKFSFANVFTLAISGISLSIRLCWLTCFGFITVQFKCMTEMFQDPFPKHYYYCKNWKWSIYFQDIFRVRLHVMSSFTSLISQSEHLAVLERKY